MELFHHTLISQIVPLKLKNRLSDCFTYQWVVLFDLLDLFAHLVIIYAVVIYV